MHSKKHCSFTNPACPMVILQTAFSIVDHVATVFSLKSQKRQYIYRLFCKRLTLSKTDSRQQPCKQEYKTFSRCHDGSLRPLKLVLAAKCINLLLHTSKLHTARPVEEGMLHMITPNRYHHNNNKKTANLLARLALFNECQLIPAFKVHPIDANFKQTLFHLERFSIIKMYASWGL